MNSTENERIDNYLALVRLGSEEDEDNETSLYALFRDARKNDEDELLFSGVQSGGELSSAASR